MGDQPPPTESLGRAAGVILAGNQSPPRSSLIAIQVPEGSTRSRPVSKTIRRHKLSRSGKEARELLKYDRSDPWKTTKIHIVEERNEAGEWLTVHDENEEYPAKRRPNRSRGEGRQ